MRVSRRSWIAVIVVAVVLAAGIIKGGVLSGSYSFGPFKLTVDGRGNITTAFSAVDFVTPIGAFSLGASKAIDAAKGNLLLFRDNRRPEGERDRAYRVDAKNERVVAYLNGFFQLTMEDNRYVIDTSAGIAGSIDVMSEDVVAAYIRSLPSGQGYAPPCQGVRLVAADGGVFDYWAPHVDRPDDRSLHPVVGAAATPTCRGYWTVDSIGGVHSHGDAQFFGALPGRTTPVAPIVGIVATRTGRGYWLFAKDGGVFAFGDAPAPPPGWEPSRFNDIAAAVDNGGRTPTLFGALWGAMSYVGLVSDRPSRANAPIVGGAATPSHNGYWLVGADGGVFGYGDAGYHGSMGGKPLAAPIVGIAATPSGKGYWLTGADGGVFAFGDAAFSGSMKQLPIILNAPVVAIIPAS